MAYRRGAWALAWLAAWAAGCSGATADDNAPAASGNSGGSSSGGAGSSGAGGTTTSSPDGQACVRMINVTCATSIACEPLVSQVLYSDLTSCIAAFTTLCNALDELPGENRLVADYDACTEAYQAMSCEALWSGNLPAACQASAGSLGNGSPCAAGFQCQSTYCKFDASGSSNCGVCAPRNPVGGSCQAAAGCEPGLLCSPGSPSVCVVPEVAGAGCDTSHPCQSGLACISGVCASPLGAGAACANITECDVRRGLWCTSGVCQPITLADAGEPCDNSANWCRAAAYCSNSGAGAGTCVARVANGAACTEDNQCQFASQCTDGVCAAFQYRPCQ